MITDEQNYLPPAHDWITGDLITDVAWLKWYQNIGNLHKSIKFVNIEGNIDDISDGTTYGRIKITAIDANGIVIMDQISGDLDDIANGTSYAKVSTASLTAGGLVLLDQVDTSGTYGLVNKTAISAGKITLDTNGVTGTLAVSFTQADVTADESQNLDWIDGSSGTLSITSTGSLEISAVSGILIKSGGDMQIESGGDMVIKSGGGLTVNDGGGVSIDTGGDIVLDSESGNPAIIQFNADSRSYYMACDFDADRFCFYPDTHKTGKFAFGYDFASGDKFLDYFSARVYRGIQLYGYEDGTGDDSWFNVIGGTTVGAANAFVRLDCGEVSNGYIQWSIIHGGADTLSYAYLNIDGTRSYYFDFTDFYPSLHKNIDCGKSGNAWDDVWADDFQNVADFLYLDTIDDLEAIKQIKGSGNIDERSGFETINDDTLPDVLKTKDKEGKDFVLSNDGKPYIALKNAISLCWGAIRQLDKKIEDMKN